MVTTVDHSMSKIFVCAFFGEINSRVFVQTTVFKFKKFTFMIKRPDELY